MVALLWPLHLPLTSAPCNNPAQQAEVAEAIERIARSIDPCGESPEVVRLLQHIKQCAGATYQICTDVTAERNWFDRPDDSAPQSYRTINWNPTLRDEVEQSCDGDAAQPVRRDPTASLLHELAHAAQDCEGLNPNEHEFDAVRIENIYRRAVGLCQRSKYGDDPLPDALRKSCTPEQCLCTPPSPPRGGERIVAPAITETSAETAPGDAQAAPDTH